MGIPGGREAAHCGMGSKLVRCFQCIGVLWCNLEALLGFTLFLCSASQLVRPDGRLCLHVIFVRLPIVNMSLSVCSVSAKLLR